MAVGTFVQPDFQSQTGTEYKTNIDNAVAVSAVAGKWFAPRQSSPAGMSVVVDQGRVWNPLLPAGVFEPSPVTVDITPPATNPRIDRLVLDPWDGAVEHIQGPEAAAPGAPAVPNDRLPLARIENLTPATVQITNQDIVDERVPNGLGLGNAARQDHSEVVKSAAYTVTLADHGKMIRCDTTGGPFTVTLPDPLTVFDGFVVAIKRPNAGGANALTIDSAGAAAIDGAATLVLESELDAVVLSAGPLHWQVRAAYRLRDGQVTGAKIASDAVGLDQIAHATRGNLMYWGSGGAPAMLIPGTAGQVLTTQGLGADPAWAPSTFAGQLLHVVDEKPPGTNGGTFTSGAWRTRDLNTVKTNEIAGASLSANQITLGVGEYFLRATAPGRDCLKHQIKWRNITDSVDEITGRCAAALQGNDSYVSVSGRFSISGVSKAFELQHICQGTRATDGLGTPGNFGITETFAEIMIWRIA